MERQVVNIGGLLAANDDLRKAYEAGEQWAVDYVKKSQQLNDGNRYAFERSFDGKPRNWCGGCPFPSGCIVCTLNPPRTRHERVPPYDTD